MPAHVLVVLDEAYIEYAEGQELPDGLAYLADYPNLLVSRTFSKAYGPAALRVGYAISSPVIADVLNRVRQPFNVNSLALAAACAALDDVDYLAASRRVNDAGMAQLERGFRQLGLEWIPRGAISLRWICPRCCTDQSGTLARGCDRAAGSRLRNADIPAGFHWYRA